MLYDLDSESYSCSCDVELEHFIQGFISGYKVVKDANFNTDI